MSDILIENMKMPKKGEYLMTLYVDSDGSAYIDVESFPEGKDKFDAIEVPPHGRLIDADALKLTAFAYSNNFIHKVMVFGGQMVYSESAIDNAPTIIEAEDGET